MKKVQLLDGGRVCNVTDRHAEQLIAHEKAILFEEKVKGNFENKEEKAKEETKELKVKRQTKMKPVIKSTK